MKMLGLNPSDQELLDIPNKIARDGLIYYPDFCQLCLEYFRQEGQEDDFSRNLFKVSQAFLSVSHWNISDPLWDRSTSQGPQSQEIQVGEGKR